MSEPQHFFASFAKHFKFASVDIQGRIFNVVQKERRGGGRDEADDRLGFRIRKLGFPSDDRLGLRGEVDDGLRGEVGELNREGQCKLWRDR